MNPANMTRRTFLERSALGATGLITSVRGGPAPESNRPNIVLILADDLGYGDVGCYGQQRIRTPSLDRLAAEGMRFTDHYAGSTVCAPSRATLMLGRHTGHLRTPSQGQVLRQEDAGVAALLKGKGYATACIGKWGLGQEETTGLPTKHGFDTFFGYLNQRHAHNYYPEFLWRGEQRVRLRNTVVRPARKSPGPYAGGASTKRVDYSHDLFTREALTFVEANKERPFFLYLPYTIPHANNEASILKKHGMEVPDYGIYADEDWPEPQKGHAAMISRLDRDVGRLAARLRELGIHERTLVLFSSDNGPHREGGADPAFFKSSGPLRGIKRDLYEGGIRVPLIAWWPGTVPAGTVADHPSAFWDFLPTACELAGVTVPGAIDGVSYLPTLLGRKGQRQHDYLYWEFLERGGKQALRMGRWKAIRQDLRRLPHGPIELYDLQTDIAEAHNVGEAHPNILRQAEALFADIAREHPAPRPFDKPRPVDPGPRPPLPDVHLSQLEPMSATSGYAPLGPPKMNRSIRGQPITVDGKSYERGIGVHAPSELVYALRPDYRRFVAVVGVDDERPGSMAFEVFVDGKCVARTHVLQPKQLWHLDVPLPPGAKRIRLLATDGGDGQGNDHGDWIDAGFIAGPGPQ